MLPVLEMLSEAMTLADVTGVGSDKVCLSVFHLAYSR
jgi:hypothetical protein